MDQHGLITLESSPYSTLILRPMEIMSIQVNAAIEVIVIPQMEFVIVTMGILVLTAAFKMH